MFHVNSSVVDIGLYIDISYIDVIGPKISHIEYRYSDILMYFQNIILLPNFVHNDRPVDDAVVSCDNDVASVVL